jgi:hypothetical protein
MDCLICPPTGILKVIRKSIGWYSQFLFVSRGTVISCLYGKASILFQETPQQMQGLQQNKGAANSLSQNFLLSLIP